MHYNNKFIPEVFLQKFSLNYLIFGSNNSPFVTFSIDEILPHAFTIKNEHGNKVVFASETEQTADAHIIVGTNQEIKNLPHKYLAIKTADCLPIVCAYQDEKYFIGGITHAGWRGFTSQIISNTVLKLKEEASKFKIDEKTFIQNLKVYIAPAIFGVSYECGNDVKEALEKHKQYLFQNSELNIELAQIFNVCANVKTAPVLAEEIEHCAKKYQRVLQPHSIFPDLQLLAVFECVKLGLLQENISIFRENTYGHTTLCSYRELCHQGNPGSKSRFWTYLCLPGSSNDAMTKPI